MIDPTIDRFDYILDNPKTGTLEWYAEDSDALNRWGWCDALFMAPPVWARLSTITGDGRYLDFMDSEFKATYDVLWDDNEHLFFRDTRFITQFEKNGKHIFWSRGNGWVFGGLALMIPDLPANWRERQFYIDTFIEMAETLRKAQRTDGTWSMGLLGDEAAYPIQESSGTAFFTFGIAWGINQGFLPEDDYKQVVLNAWNALLKNVTEEGYLEFVQPIGAAPGESVEGKTELYAIGAFLAAASQVHELVSD